MLASVNTICSLRECRVIVQKVELDIVRLAVGQVHVHREARCSNTRPPRSGPIPRRILEGLGHGGAGRPGVGRVAGWGDGGVGGVVDSVGGVDHVVSLTAVHPDPGALRRRVLAVKGCGRWSSVDRLSQTA